jgi:CIC family chloride channel protein
MHYTRRLRLPLDTPTIGEQTAFVLIVTAAGAGMGLVALGFQAMLRGANRLFFGPFRQPDLTANLLSRPYLALVPATGGLLVGLYFRYVVRRPAGHGVSEVVVALETRGSRLHWIAGIHTAIASSITIGSGGSAGPEGPIIQIGASLAAPLTGAAFAAEVLLEELEPRSLALIALAAVAAGRSRCRHCPRRPGRRCRWTSCSVCSRHRWALRCCCW